MDEEIVIIEPVAEAAVEESNSAVIADTREDDLIIVEEQAPSIKEAKYTEDDLAAERDRVAMEMQRAQANEALRAEMELQNRIRAREEEELFEQQIDLIKRADEGDLEAQEEIYQQKLTELRDRAKALESKKIIEPERAKIHNDVRRSLWEEYSKSFGIAPDDKELMDIPAEKGMRGINAALIRKTQDAEIIEAAKQNPVLRKWIKEEMERGSQAASARGMAKALGSNDAPKADAGINGGGKTMTVSEMERAFQQYNKNQKQEF
ncbi:MAG: hypothetical protein EB154_09920 [Nitrosopumilaceae archaeon]|nr:hypothetical protein [Nitrosopumilaceae archaeon]